jgi:hypothetical protein
MDLAVELLEADYFILGVAETELGVIALLCTKTLLGLLVAHQLRLEFVGETDHLTARRNIQQAQ